MRVVLVCVCMVLASLCLKHFYLMFGGTFTFTCTVCACVCGRVGTVVPLETGTLIGTHDATDLFHRKRQGDRRVFPGANNAAAFSLGWHLCESSGTEAVFDDADCVGYVVPPVSRQLAIVLVPNSHG